MLRLGSTGAAVVALQRHLRVTPDGIFGPATQAALIAFQRAHHLTPDGIYGPATAAAMTGGSTSGGGTAGGTSAADTERKREIAAGFGYTLAFFDADPSLRDLLNRAIDTTHGTWTAAYFQAQLQNTAWFRTHSESYRKYIALQTTDPSTLSVLRRQTIEHVHTMALQMGAALSTLDLTNAAENALKFGYTDEQIKRWLTSHIRTSTSGLYQGDAVSASETFKKIASDYGVSLSDTTLASFVKSSVSGAVNADYVKQWAAAQAASRYPALAAQLKSGMSLRQILDPYVQSYAKVLELNPETIQLTDPLLQSAVTGKDAKGAPSTKTVWQFEQDLRNDPRWTKTQAAQDSVMSTARSVLRDFGFSQ